MFPDDVINVWQNYFVESRDFCSFKTGKSYIVRPNLTCSSKNIIFLVSCKNASFSILTQQPPNSRSGLEITSHL